MKKLFRKVAVITAFLFPSVSFYAQTDDEKDLLSLVEEEEAVNYATSAFKSSRIINGHSIENTPEGVLDFRISHRFGFVNSGPYDFFGLDQAFMRLGFDYGITDRLMVGMGHSNFNKVYDSFVKYKILRQSTGKRKMPVSVAWVSSINCNTLKWADPERKNFFTSRLSYSHQLLIARKFNENLTLQIMPTLVHRNIVPRPEIRNDVLAVGAGGRYKLTKRLSINAEYFYVLPGQMDSMFTNSFSVGVDIETGGHVFQLQFTNSTSMVEPGFITETVGHWEKGDIHFGFNISRVFTIKKRKSPAEW
ncbi:MAG: hypothetical protein IT223_07630 [Crocinitomicaceae bacterium]|nr:hypothetical protein [Crocinitomicaceae bacterium]